MIYAGKRLCMSKYVYVCVCVCECVCVYVCIRRRCLMMNASQTNKRTNEKCKSVDLFCWRVYFKFYDSIKQNKKMEENILV